MSEPLALAANCLSAVLLAILAYEARKVTWRLVLLVALGIFSVWRVADHFL